METVKYNNRDYCVAVQGFDNKNSTYQDICIYLEREYILYEWYCSMAYLCVLNNTEEKYVFLEFVNTVFKDG